MLLAVSMLPGGIVPGHSQGQPAPPASAQPSPGQPPQGQQVAPQGQQVAPQGQQVVPQAQPPAAQGAPQPVPQDAARKPGNAFEAIGQWWDKSQSDLKQSIDENNAKWRRSVDEQNARWRQGVEEQNSKWRELNAKNEQAAKDAAAASREAAEAFQNLSKIRIVEGRQVCEPAANGSPDCETAAQVFCKSKGFTTGKSADITTSRKCSMRSILNRDERECKVETTIVKAACQ